MYSKEVEYRQPKTTSLWSVIALLSLIVSAVTLGLWVYHETLMSRYNERIEAVQSQCNERIEAVQSQCNVRIEALEERLSVYQSSKVSQ